MRIALDAMGGDDAPDINVDGAIDALQKHEDLEVFLVGDEARLNDLLTERGVKCGRLTVHAADGVLEMHEKPTVALREKPNCSIAACWKLMAAKEADALVSAGNTGGVVSAGLRTRLFLKGVKRPGIAVVLPTLRGRALLLDVGANPGARAEHLFQYGVIGTQYTTHVLGIENPRIGLMNIGTEEGKGNELAKETHQILSQSCLRDRYVGNVEGRGLYQGEADVLICEGFVGNIVLKVSEGMASMMLKMLSKEVLECLDQERHLAAQAFQNLGKQYAYSEVGGAPLLGVDGICLICHGSSDRRAIANALGGALLLKDSRINAHIIEELAAANAAADA